MVESQPNIQFGKLNSRTNGVTLALSNNRDAIGNSLFELAKESNFWNHCNPYDLNN